MFRAAAMAAWKRATFSIYRLLASAGRANYRAIANAGVARVSITASSTLIGLSLFTKKGDGGDKIDDSPLVRKSSDYNRAVQEADLFYDAYMIDNAFKILNRFRDSDNAEVLWRLARVTCEKGKISKDAKEKRDLFYEALAFAEKALKAESGSSCFGAHKWYAIILDYVGEQEGTKSRILKSYEVKTHLERALEINPLDATTWHILGIWHYSFADLSTMSRLAAKAIFGTPPSSTYEDALRHFEKAEAIKPNFYSANDYYVGLVYDRLGKRDEAVKWFKKAFAAPVLSADDGETHKKALEMLGKHGITQTLSANDKYQQEAK